MNIERLEAPTVSEQRKEILREVFRDLKGSDALRSFEAVIGFGSTFRGDAREDSDIDIMCITKNGSALAENDWKAAQDAIQQKLPNVVLQLGGGSKDMILRFVTRRSDKDKEPAWEILYVEGGDPSALNSEIEKLKTKK